MSYTIKQTDRYNSFSADEQSQIQSAGQSEYDRYFKEASGVYGDNAQIRGSAQEVGQRAAESAFTKFDQQKSQAQMANDVAQSNAFNNWTAQNPNAASVPTQFDPQGTYQTVNGTLTNKSSVQQAAATQAAVAAGTMKAVPLTGAGQSGTGYVQTGGAAEANLANPVNQPTGIPQGGTPALATTPAAQTPQMSLISQGNLSQGMYDNENVKQLQGLLGITTDGDFGPQTKQAVENFQKANNLTVDGIVGPQTTAALQKLQGGSQTVNDKMLADFQSGKITAEQYNQQAVKMVTDKYQQTHDALKGTTASSDGGEARNVINSTSPTSSVVPASSPAVDALFTEDKNIQAFQKQVQELLSPQTQEKSFVDTYKQMLADTGLEALNTEAMNLDNLMDGTEDSIRQEITKAGGFATENQIQALTIARNKTYLTKYKVIQQQIAQKQNMINTTMGLEEKDRAAASDKLDKQLNLSFQLQDLQTKMKSTAADSLNKIVSQVGYAGLEQMAQGNSYYTGLVEKTLGLAPGGLNQLATYTPPMSEADQLDLQYKKGQIASQASNLKTDELQRANIKSQISDRNITSGKESGIAPVGSPANIKQQAQTEQSIADVQSIIDNPYIRSAVGPTWLGRFIGQGLDTATGDRQNYIASVEKLRSQLSLDSLINAKAKGATFGALSDTEMRILSASASKLGSWAKTNDKGEVTAYSASEKDFIKELNTINNFAKLDYILKGGNPEQIGVQAMPDGSFVVKNSDGSYTTL